MTDQPQHSRIPQPADKIGLILVGVGMFLLGIGSRILRDRNGTLTGELADARRELAELADVDEHQGDELETDHSPMCVVIAGCERHANVTHLGPAHDCQLCPNVAHPDGFFRAAAPGVLLEETP